ncbi:putative thioredoxin-disulfide reductase [Lupinus albus]|uniref:Glutaredoxin n=1 Tax=Lupinus albus TaxID=3870 RepID=A0A6A4NL80_LUPAL|nr:putative thioredoxin-disulfide reductase [Lupinus albus]
MGSVMSSKKSKEELEMALNKAKEIASSSSVVVFSKTYCGYCKRVKNLLTQLAAAYKVIELDEESDGRDIQLALAEWTGLRTVPNVFIGGKHIGGCDLVLEKHRAGQLVPLLNDAGAIASNSAQL